MYWPVVGMQSRGIRIRVVLQLVGTSFILLMFLAACSVGPTAAPTPTAVAKGFLEAMVKGDISTASARMSVAAQSSYASKLPAVASALVNCRNSVMEVTALQAAKGSEAVQAQFTPPCGDARAASSALFGQLMTGPTRPVSVVTLQVQSVNEEWKVTMLYIY